jgi:CRP-like cAMP-binding protein
LLIDFAAFYLILDGFRPLKLRLALLNAHWPCLEWTGIVMQQLAVSQSTPCATPSRCGIDLAARLRLIADSHLFRGMAMSDQVSLALAMDERRVRSGANIFRQGDEATALFAVMAGQVRIVLGSADGRGHVLRCLGTREFFGEIAVLEGAQHGADALAVTNCQLLMLDRRRLVDLLERQPRVAMNLIAMLGDRLRATSGQVEGLLFQSLDSRLADVLLQLLAGRKTASVNITQAELGEMTGVTRETINKKLRAWQAAGMVSLQPGRVVVLDPVRLRAASTPRAESKEKKAVLF